MKEKIEDILGNLLGIALVAIGRSCDLEWFQFGDLIEIVDHRGNKRKVSEYALHVQCGWRITDAAGIIVASQDRFYPREGWEGNIEDFNWDVQGENRSDQLVCKFLKKNKENILIVKSVRADRFGGFELSFSNEVKLEVFPDGTTNAEHWRFFKPYSEVQHFIVTSNGIEEE